MSSRLVKRCWALLVEKAGEYEGVGAGGEFRSDLMQKCGVDTSRFSVVGLGLERIAMIRYGIDDIRARSLSEN
jgi:phenylalanyl-tRNA synthetase alpha subunit